MAIDLQNYQTIRGQIPPEVTLVAVSKIKPVQDIQALYDAGQRDFGENYVQELLDKQAKLPEDIRWHFIGHLQSNKVKMLVPFVHLIHGVDSLRLLREISKQAIKQEKRINCLLQLHIAREETKFGLDTAELEEISAAYAATPDAFKGVQIKGMMGMASNMDQEGQIRQEFRQLVSLANEYLPKLSEGQEKPVLSFGMSGDYKIALEEGSNMLRIGSLLFGARSKTV